MEFRTKVDLPAGIYEIRHSDRLMLWGSCFAENIGKLLSDNKFTCDINPFGILYNPLSVAEALEEIAAQHRYEEADLRVDNGQWYSLMHHGSFSSPDKETCLAQINTRIQQGATFLRQADWLLMTWGTARVYRWKEDGRIVGNCHKLPEKLFERYLLDAEDIVTRYKDLLPRLKALNPQLKVIFTVSPIRHAKDGMHGNQLNKAVLLIAIEQLCRLFPFCHYFPSYEIMMDELRDYRFYADDMLHPSPLAVKYIWECVCQTYFRAPTLQVMKEWETIQKGLAHRPFNEDSEVYHTFLSQILLKIERLKEKLPYLDVQNEITLCQTRLKKSLLP